MPNARLSHSSILLIAGDVSGDVHAAALARTLLARDPNRTVHALGGKRLRKAVAESPDGKFLADTTHSSAIGLLWSIRLYFHCRKLRERLREFIRAHRIDLVILCDWGGFNKRILPELHAHGLRVLYYIPPGAWQRTGARAFGIVPYVTRIATPFQWSAERLRSAGAHAEWVGHPVLENFPPAAERPALRRKFGVQPNETLISLLPGSRFSEIRVLATRMAKAAAIVNAEIPARFIAVLPQELADEARTRLPASIQIVSDCAKEVLLASDAAIVKTGTGTLEAVAADTPQVTVYDVSNVVRIEWLLLWSWRWIPFIAMPNIVMQRQVVPELVGPNCNPRKIAQTLIGILQNEVVRGKMLQDYAAIRHVLGSELPMPPTERTAEIVEEILCETAVQASREGMAVHG